MTAILMRYKLKRVIGFLLIGTRAAVTYEASAIIRSFTGDCEDWEIVNGEPDQLRGRRGSAEIIYVL